MAIAEKTICSFAMAASLLLAQAPAPSAGNSTEAAPAALVGLEVVAVDSSGQPVTDLTADDLKVTDQGKPEAIVCFRRNQAEVASLKPGEYSNRSAAPHHSAVVLFDLLNESKTDVLDVWHGLDRLLPQIESGDSLYFYILTMEGTLNAIHAIGTSADDHTWNQQVAKVLDKTMKGAVHARPLGMNDEECAKKTYVALETLGNQLAAFPGGRDIIWITNGIPNVWNPKTPCNGDWVDCALYVPHLAVTLDRDNAAVNPLSYTSNPDPGVARDIEFMASLTGGKAYFQKDLPVVLKQVAQDAATSYSIAYEPSPDNWDNKFHKVRVTCERKGVKLQAKQRYYAYLDNRPAATKQQTAVGAAYHSPFDAAEVGLRATVTPSAGIPQSLHLEIRINPADLLLREQLGHFADTLTFVSADLGATGPIGDPTVSSFNLDLTREQRDGVMKEGIPIAIEHPINDSIQKVRLIVLDQASNAVGSLTFPAGTARK